jgi:hypothetical protein
MFRKVLMFAITSGLAAKAFRAYMDHRRTQRVAATTPATSTAQPRIASRRLRRAV